MTNTANENGEIWNPNAAINWSLLLSPAFGAYIHALNWRKLGEEGRAKTAMIWFYVILGLLIVTFLAAINEGTASPGSVSFGLLLIWYFFAGKVQAKYVKEKFGSDYARLSWYKPLTIGIAAFLGFVLLIG